MYSPWHGCWQSIGLLTAFAAWPWKVKLLKRDREFGWYETKREIEINFLLKVTKVISWAWLNISCPWKVISWKWRRYFVERELILLSLTEICLDLDNNFVEREANFVSWILHHLAFHIQGKLTFLLSFGFILSLRYYFVHTHIEILPVLVSDGSSKFVSLI